MRARYPHPTQMKRMVSTVDMSAFQVVGASRYPIKRGRTGAFPPRLFGDCYTQTRFLPHDSVSKTIDNLSNTIKARNLRELFQSNNAEL